MTPILNLLGGAAAAGLVTMVAGSEVTAIDETQVTDKTLLYTPSEVGRFFLAAARENADALFVSAPAGFVVHEQDRAAGDPTNNKQVILDVYSIEVTPGMVGVQQSWTFVYSNARRSVLMGLLYSGVDQASPIGVEYSDVDATANRTSAGGGSLSNADVGDNVFAVGVAHGYFTTTLSVSNLAGYTQAGLYDDGSASYVALMWTGHKEVTVAGAQTTPTYAATQAVGMLAYAVQVNAA